MGIVSCREVIDRKTYPTFVLPSKAELLLLPVYLLQQRQDVFDAFLEARNDPSVCLFYSPSNRHLEEGPTRKTVKDIRDLLARKRKIFETAEAMRANSNDIRPIPCVVAIRSAPHTPQDATPCTAGNTVVVLPDGLPATIVGYFACSNYKYEGDPEGMEAAVWLSAASPNISSCMRGIGELLFAFAAHTYLSQCAAAQVAPYFAHVWLRTMRINWRMTHLVMRLLSHFGEAVGTEQLSATSITGECGIVDLQFCLTRECAERVAMKMYNFVACLQRNSESPTLPSAVLSPSRVGGAATDSSSPKDVDVVEVARRFFPNSSVVDWLSTFEPLRKAVQRYAHDHPDDPEGDVTDSNGATYHIRRAFTVPQHQSVVLNVERLNPTDADSVFLPQSINLFVHGQPKGDAVCRAS